MADFKFYRPFSVWYFPWVGYKIKLSHTDIEAINNATSPLAVITGLIPNVGPFIAAAINLQMWLIDKIDKKYGYNGVVVIAGFGGIGWVASAIKPSSSVVVIAGFGGIHPLVRNPDIW